MNAKRLVGLLAVVVATSCQTYSPAPVDLVEHARQFAERIPDAPSIRQFVERLRSQDPVLRPLDPADGLDLQEAHYVALLFNPELRTIRLRAGVTRVAAENAGRWADPTLNGNFAKIMESVTHPWLAGGSIGLTLPITGRPGLEKELAESQHARALVEARVAEARALNNLDGAWARWSAALLAVELIEDLVQRLVDLEAIVTRLAAAQLLNQVEARAFTLERVSRQAQLVRTKASVAMAEIEIKQVLGLPPDRPLTLSPTIAIPMLVADAAERRSRLLDSPSVAVAKRDHEVAERQLALAVRQQWPELTLFPGFQEEDAQPRPALGFSLPLPLWNANAREIAATRAGRDVAAAALRGQFERAVQALARFEVRRAVAMDQRSLVDTQLVPLAEQQVADGRRLADLGQLNTLLILDTLQRSYEAKALAIEAALAEAEATIEINALFWPALTVGEAPEAGR
ncbi:MAG: TolC family protein [Planctomycetota bacterium]